jgi:hypothetical protein
MKYKSNFLKKYYVRTIFVMSALLLSVSGLTACQSETDGGPLGPTNLTTSSANITVSPATLSLVKAGAQTFSATGGSGTFTWSVDNQSLGSITTNNNQGDFVAGNTNGTITVTATDFNGSTGTATVTITNKSLTLTPSAVSVGKQGTQDFTLQGGATNPVFFSLSNTTIGSFAATTTNVATFTAGITEGTATVTATDADGDSVVGTVTIVSNTVTLTPAAVTSSTALAGTIFTAGGSVGDTPSFTFALSGQSNSYAGATLTPSTTDTTLATLVTTVPTLAEGNQTLTITATDANGDTATSQITLIAATV